MAGSRRATHTGAKGRRPPAAACTSARGGRAGHSHGLGFSAHACMPNGRAARCVCCHGTRPTTRACAGVRVTPWRAGQHATAREAVSAHACRRALGPVIPRKAASEHRRAGAGASTYEARGARDGGVHRAPVAGVVDASAYRREQRLHDPNAVDAVGRLGLRVRVVAKRDLPRRAGRRRSRGCATGEEHEQGPACKIGYAALSRVRAARGHLLQRSA